MSAFLSNIELYYSASIMTGESEIELIEEEFHHAVNVMRNREGSDLYITNGKGKIFLCSIERVCKTHLTARIKEQNSFLNQLQNVTFCFPALKNPDRFKFALEKCTELGITNFIIFDSTRSVAKIKNVEKFNKTLLSAMKQSLRAYLPSMTTIKNCKELLNLDGEKIVFDQGSNNLLSKEALIANQQFFIFGPEGGFTDEELSLFSNRYRLSDFRLRTETAIVKCASILC